MPTQPDGEYKLDLRVFGDRQIATLLLGESYPYLFCFDKCGRMLDVKATTLPTSPMAATCMPNFEMTFELFFVSWIHI